MIKSTYKDSSFSSHLMFYLFTFGPTAKLRMNQKSTGFSLSKINYHFKMVEVGI